MKKIAFLFTLISGFIFSQSGIKITHQSGSENEELSGLLDFENIYVEQITFEAEEIKDKYYEITIEEFVDGEFKKKDVLVDGIESPYSEYFKNRSNTLSLKFFCKMEGGKLKTYIRGEFFGGKKTYFDLQDKSKDRYVLKNFTNGSPTIHLKEIKIEKDIPILAIITPTIHSDGSGSYCEVAQSGIAPRDLGKHFKIPHYFIINIQFKDKK